MYKKILFIILSVLLVNKVYAQDLDITENAEIRYKWFKEKIVDEKYYPKKDSLEGYIEDPTKIKYGEISNLNSTNCNLPQEYYKIYEERIHYKYKIVEPVRYLVFEELDSNVNVLIMLNNSVIDYKIIDRTQDKLTIDLQKGYRSSELAIILNKVSSFTLNIYADYDYTLTTIKLSKKIENEQIIYPNDSTWLQKNTVYVKYQYSAPLKEDDLTIFYGNSKECSYQEIYTYRYKKVKEYYDDNYYKNIENYLPDKNDYKIYYTKSFPVATITKTIEKTIKEDSPQTEYIYVEVPSISSTPREIIKTEYIKTKVPYIPKAVYIIFCITLVIFLINFAKKIRNMSKK